ncbi:MAG TPA: class I SAM-dependent methyltransferase [Actinocrinis sp.]
MDTGAEQADPEAASAEWLKRASSFGAAAAQYAQHRPGYAEAAIRWCLAPVGDASQPVRVLDLGAGTGILTGGIARLGADVVAVEPDPEMRAELRRRLPAVRVLEGRAEELPLPDQSVDAVLCGQAMHWFDMDRALPEIARVLTPGGVLAGLWNVEDDRVGWVAELAAMTESGSTLSLWRSAQKEDDEHSPLRVGTDRFAPAQVGEFDNAEPRSPESLVAFIATTSRFLLMPQEQRTETLAAIGEFLGRRPETSGGEFTMPLITAALRAVRRS